MIRPELWGSLRQKYEEDRPRRMLSLDGGGIRGLITLGILESIEKMLREAISPGENFRLGEWFDYIGGTSTGAILAAGLARGMSVAELIEFYVSTGPEMFEKSHLLKRFWSLYNADPLRDKLRTVMNQPQKGDPKVVGDKDLDLSPDYLRSLLLIVTRNATTDSPWPISSNPDAKYNKPDRKDCNLRIPLWRLVRASTAAPVYFPPEILNWDESDPGKSFVFVDGGMTPYNNPAFLLYRMATQEPYRLCWKTGEKDLLLISVGTGEAPKLGPSTQDPAASLLGNAATIPSSLLNAMSIEQDLNCRTVGRCSHGAVIDRELLDLICRETADDWTLERRSKVPRIPLEQDMGRAFLYARYNADLSKKGLEAVGLGDLNPEEVQKLDAVKQIDHLLAIGRATGQQVSAEHFGGFIKPS
jgi:predicted acylesterase/phospholipase RssA